MVQVDLFQICMQLRTASRKACTLCDLCTVTNTLGTVHSDYGRTFDFDVRNQFMHWPSRRWRVATTTGTLIIFPSPINRFSTPAAGQATTAEPLPTRGGYRTRLCIHLECQLECRCSAHPFIGLTPPISGCSVVSALTHSYRKLR